VSVSSAEAQGNGWSSGGLISADGRYVAFSSSSTNLAGAGDTNGEYDVFVRDLELGTTTQVSVSSSEVRGNGQSLLDAMSADGRYVVFHSLATNLVAGDTNGKKDVFVRDTVNGTTARVSVRSDATQANGDSYTAAISDDGRYIAFASEASNLITTDGNGAADIFVRDMTLGTIVRVSVSNTEVEANGLSENPFMSADGRYVVFQSYANNLVTGDTNGEADVFIRDTVNGTTERMSVTSAEAQATTGRSINPGISAGGRFVTFESDASDLVTGDTNGWTDVFVRDRQAGTTKRVSRAYDGNQPNSICGGPVISRDGTLIAFCSDAYNLTPVDSGGWWQVYAARTPNSVVYPVLKGVDRYDTAIKISKAMFPGPLPADSGVVLAPGTTFPEALCGAPLAHVYGGPVLLNSTTILYSTVKAELQRLAPDHVFCIGLSSTVATKVQEALPAADVVSIGGSTIYHMSRNVANAMDARVGGLSGAVALITIGTKFPDALAIAPLACAKHWPIILTDQTGDGLHAQASSALMELNITHAIKVGTYSTLPDWVVPIANLSGADRYVTNANVARWADTNAGLDFTCTAFATGDKFPDALAAGPYLAQDNGILLLSPLTGPVPAVIAATLSANAMWVHELSFIACVEPVISQVKALLP
jgi:Tol biopolymer transport system component/putative cell wall-binding protein